MITLYVCECGRSLAIASDKLHVPPERISCDACGRAVLLTLKRLIRNEIELAQLSVSAPE